MNNKPKNLSKQLNTQLHNQLDDQLDDQLDQGSYTGVRVGVTVANALAWSLDRPVLGYKNDNLDAVLSQALLMPSHFTKSVLPTYSAT